MRNMIKRIIIICLLSLIGCKNQSTPINEKILDIKTLYTNDERWESIPLTSCYYDSTMGSDGSSYIALSIVANYLTSNEITPLTMDIPVYYCNIDWEGNAEDAGIKHLDYDRYPQYDGNQLVKDYIDQDLPVIIYLKNENNAIKKYVVAYGYTNDEEINIHIIDPNNKDIKYLIELVNEEWRVLNYQVFTTDNSIKQELTYQEQNTLFENFLGVWNSYDSDGYPVSYLEFYYDNQYNLRFFYGSYYSEFGLHPDNQYINHIQKVDDDKYEISVQYHESHFLCEMGDCMSPESFFTGYINTKFMKEGYIGFNFGYVDAFSNYTVNYYKQPSN